MEKLVLIDGNSLINRAFYAMPLLSTKSGEYTNAVYGFMNMFFKILSEDKPTYIAVAFDLKAPTFRHKMYSEYKGTRKPMPEELRPQIGLLKEVLSLMGVTTIEKEGFEADDIIGTIAKNTSIKTLIYTGDRDSFQLVDSETEVHFTKRGITDLDILTNDNFKEKTGINPLQIIELKALMGDASDNIPGVAGVGEKTALTLVQNYGDIENLYTKTEELTGKLKEKIELGKESAFLSKTLATIDTNAPIDFDIEKMRFSLPLSNEVKQKFILLEFKSLYGKSELFATEENGEKSLINSEKTPQIINKLTLEGVEKYFNSGNSLSIDKNSFNIFNIATNEEIVYKIRQTLLDDGVTLSEVLTAIKPLLSSDKRIIVYDKKELKHLVYSFDKSEIFCEIEDLSIIKYLADYSGKAQALSEVLLEYNMSEKTSAFSIFALYNILYKKLIELDMENLYKNVELPLADVLFLMEIAGFKIDVQALSTAGESYKKILTNIETEIKNLSGESDINIQSPKQLGELIFEKLKLGKGKKTKTGYSTNAEVLESLENAHPIIPLILQYRKIQKLYSTYIEGFKPLIDKETGLIHTTFNQTVTSTGRLSSSEPNLQNIPVRDEEGKELRKFFVPRDSEHILVGADYSQIELRLLASFSNTQSLIEAYKNGKDIHAQTASKVFKTPLQNVTKEMRSRAKAVNFGIIYGISEYGLAKQLKISPNEARGYITSYFMEYPEVKKYMEDNVNFAKANGYAKTLLGRKRFIRELSSSNFMLRSFGERAAMNMPLQGSSADIIKLAMLGVYKRLKTEKLKSKLILQIHDELIIDALKTEKEQVKKILIEEMENAVSLSVKLTVEAGEGETWFDAK